MAGSNSEPSSRASLNVKLEPFEGSVEVDGVPREHTRALITIIGMIAFVAAGITGATWTMAHAPAHGVAWYAGLALAQLGLAFAAVLIIAPGVRAGAGPEVAGAGRAAGEIGPSPEGPDAGQARPEISPSLS